MRSPLLILAVAGCAGAPGGPRLPRGAAAAERDPAQRWAGELRVVSEGSCSQSWASVSSRSKVVLDLADDGSASGCRALDYHHMGGSWEAADEPPERTARRERQGMRGSWRRRGEWIELRLAPVDDVAGCATTVEPPRREPAPAWHLLCARVTSRPEGPLPVPVLACRFETRLYTDELGYTTGHVLSGDWILLATEPGVVASITDYSPGLYDEELQLAPAQATIDPTAAW